MKRPYLRVRESCKGDKFFRVVLIVPTTNLTPNSTITTFLFFLIFIYFLLPTWNDCIISTYYLGMGRNNSHVWSSDVYCFPILICMLPHLYYFPCTNKTNDSLIEWFYLRWKTRECIFEISILFNLILPYHNYETVQRRNCNAIIHDTWLILLTNSDIYNFVLFFRISIDSLSLLHCRNYPTLDYFLQN